MYKEKISIIVPIYNAEKYVSECIEPVRKQSYDNWELLLIDDGSTDSSPHICDDYAGKDCRIFAYHKTNDGVSSARNYGIEISSGEMIMFVDADDLITADCCVKLYKAMKEYDADVVSGLELHKQPLSVPAVI